MKIFWLKPLASRGVIKEVAPSTKARYPIKVIPRANRFHGYGSLRHVYRSGLSARGPLFAVKALLNPKRQSYRVAVVVSRKVHKSAVARNRMRRRLYETIRELEADIAGPYDIVITVFQPNLLEESAQVLTRQMKQQLQNAGVLGRKPY